MTAPEPPQFDKTVYLALETMPLGGIRPEDHLHRVTNDNTCSRCRQEIGEDEVPLMLWPRSGQGRDLYIFCQRCAYDPDSDRCRSCGCTEQQPCEPPCGWAAPGLCTSCVDDGREG